MKDTRQFWIPLLLADPSPALRFLVLRDLLDTDPSDEELLEVALLREEDPRVISLLEKQLANGGWPEEFGQGRKGSIYRTAEALTRLGFFGFEPDYPPIQRGVDFLFSQQRRDGSWPIASNLESSERYSNYDMIPIQTAIPLRSLCYCGIAEHPNSERAFEWLMAQRLPDGTWPTGKSAGNFGGVAGYRRLAHSKWGCRTNTTEVTRCLALHPTYSNDEHAIRALDMLLTRGTRERNSLGLEVARMIGAEPTRGYFTYHAQHDPALLLNLGWRIGASKEDNRVKDLVAFIQQAQGEYGLWEYAPKPHASRWVTFDLLRSLSKVEERSDWISLEPPTPFREYLRPPKRF